MVWKLDGLTEEQFEATRDYLTKSVAMLVQTDDRRIGYALDSEFYGTPEFVDYVRDGLDRLALTDVNRAIARHLRSERLQFVVVAADAKSFRDAILAKGNSEDPATLYQDFMGREPRLEPLLERAGLI